MDREAELTVLRRAYAKQVMAAAMVDDPRVEAAFAVVQREAFLGAGPWEILRSESSGYVPTPSDDPVYIYVDEVVGLLSERSLNNGLPSLHATMLSSAAPNAGEHAVHIGIGGGYYTALLAELVGVSGSVTAIEVDPALAARASANLSSMPNVRVLQGNGVHVPFDFADVIYVNAGATHPMDGWLDRLKDSGRLILPLTIDQQSGAVFRFVRSGQEIFAQEIAPVGFFPCEGAREAESEAALVAAFATKRRQDVMKLYRGDNLPDVDCWLRAPGWCLAYP